MIKLIIEKITRILKNKKKLEEELNIKITNRGKEVFIEGEAESEFIAEKIISALDFGFPFSDALELKNTDNILEIINIKDHTKRKDLSRIRSRIIGAKGKTLKTLSELTNCAIELKDNFIGIIGDAEFIEPTNNAIISLIKGSKQGNVYAYLEKHRPKEPIDLGLRKRNDK